MIYGMNEINSSTKEKAYKEMTQSGVSSISKFVYIHYDYVFEASVPVISSQFSELTM